MSYITLYRKYRPTTFCDIVGQENITKILKSQIKSGKISHAYLFSGTRGTGKTSAAKVFARAINCLHPHDGEPCNECEVCKSILNSTSTDVVEMDAASNNSVENIRQIRQEVVYATIDVKYRVYIIDEAHMLTTSAFNALLKTLEEPPQNVIFILATTEQHKIPVTILSRCLRFEFNRISTEDILRRLQYVASTENIKYEHKALEYIAKISDGAMRDALSILDRCISEDNDILKLEDITRIIGRVDLEVINNIVDNIINYNSIETIKSIDLIIKKGRDLKQVIFQITESFLDKLINCDDNNLKERLINIIDKLSKLDNDIKNSLNPNILVKATMIEICNIDNTKLKSESKNPANIVDTEIISELRSKINVLEKQVLELTQNKTILKKEESNTNNNERVYNSKIENVESVDNLPKIQTSNTINFTNYKNIKNEDSLKKQILDQGDIKVYSAIAGTNILENNDNIVVVTNNSFAFDILNTENSINIIKQAIESIYNIKKEVLIYLNKDSDKMNKVEQFFDENNIDYKKID